MLKATGWALGISKRFLTHHDQAMKWILVVTVAFASPDERVSVNEFAFPKLTSCEVAKIVVLERNGQSPMDFTAACVQSLRDRRVRRP